MRYHKGLQITCPHCGEESVVTIISEMDGWKKLGECYACARCQQKLADHHETNTTCKQTLQKERSDKLATLLGTARDEVREVVEDDGERRFCRDCGHLLEHPFKFYCLFHKKEVSPMDDCEHFNPKKSA